MFNETRPELSELLAKNSARDNRESFLKRLFRTERIKAGVLPAVTDQGAHIDLAKEGQIGEKIRSQLNRLGQ